MTPLEITGIIVLSLVGLAMLPTIIIKFYLMIKQFKAMRDINKVTDEVFKNIDRDIKEQNRAEFFEDLEKIKKENKEEK